MTDKELEELKEKLKKEILQEIGRTKQNREVRDIVRKVKAKYKDRINNLNYLQTKRTINCMGEIKETTQEYYIKYDIETALNGLIKAIYKTDKVYKIKHSNCSEGDLSEIIDKILTLVEEERKKVETKEKEEEEDER